MLHTKFGRNRHTCYAEEDFSKIVKLISLCGYYLPIVVNPRVILIDSLFHREKTCGLKPMVCDDVISPWKKSLFLHSFEQT